MRIKNSIYIKLSISLVSLVLSLTVLEFGLRLAGYAVYNAEERNFYPSGASYRKELKYDQSRSYEIIKKEESDKKNKVILTIGDSFTNGGNVMSYQTYPYRLFKYFEERKSKVAVINMGKCEDSTFGVYRRLNKFFNDKKNEEMFPQILITLVGAADKYNLKPDINMKWVNIDWYNNKALRWFQRLRIYKVYRHIKYAVISRTLSGNAGKKKITEQDIKEYLSLYKRLKRVYFLDRSDNGTRNEIKAIKKTFLSKISVHFSEAANEWKDTKLPDRLLNAIGTTIISIYASKNRHDESLGFILDIEENFTEDFWTNIHLWQLPYNLYQIFELQSKYVAQDIILKLNVALSKYPVLKEKEAFTKFYDLMSNWDEMDEDIDRRRLETWDNIVSMCIAHDVKIIILNYPSDYQSANKMLGKIAQKYKLPFVDLHSTFSKLIKASNRDRYLEDDDHLTPEGYQIMAGEIYKEISGSIIGDSI